MIDSPAPGQDHFFLGREADPRGPRPATRIVKGDGALIGRSPQEPSCGSTLSSVAVRANRSGALLSSGKGGREVEGDPRRCVLAKGRHPAHHESR